MMELYHTREAMEAYKWYVSVYCDWILNLHLPFWWILTTMTVYATYKRLLSFTSTPANISSQNSVTYTSDATNFDGCPGSLEMLQLCWSWWLWHALLMLQPSPSSDLEVPPAVNYPVTRKQVNSQFTLAYYMDCQPFSLTRWYSGIPMTCPRVHWYCDNLIWRLFIHYR